MGDLFSKLESDILRVRDMDTMFTSAPRLSVLSVKNLDITITGAP